MAEFYLGTLDPARIVKFAFGRGSFLIMNLAGLFSLLILAVFILIHFWGGGFAMQTQEARVKNAVLLMGMPFP